MTGLGSEGWNLAFGFTNILRTDGSGSWFGDDGAILENIDMEHLPGTTSRIGGNPVNPPVTDPGIGTVGYSLNMGTSPYASGVGWGNGGVAGFHLIPKYGDFEAKKSVHFFENGYWALGSDIISTSDSIEKQNHGRFTIYLRPPLVSVVDYFFVPEFDAK